MIVQLFFLAMLGVASAIVDDFSQEITNNILKNSIIDWIIRRDLLNSGHNIHQSTDSNGVLIVLPLENRLHYLSSNFDWMQSSNELHHHITSFIGYEGDHYLLIIDAQQHLKFILPINSTNMSTFASQLQIFEMQFQSGNLNPFFASQDPLQSDRDQSCTRLVGSTYQDFLVEDEPVKIVYLYTRQTFCQICEDLLTKFKTIADKYNEKGSIRFGFIDVLKNDNRFIKDEIIPYFLIYIDENFDDPYGVGADQFDQLEQYVKRLIEDVKRSRQSVHSANREQF